MSSDDSPTLDALFARKPRRWGLRGDPFLWQEMRERFVGWPIPESGEELELTVAEAFLSLAGQPISAEESVFVERLEHGGMSGGHVWPRFWREIALPLLVKRAAKSKAAGGGRDQSDNGSRSNLRPTYDHGRKAGNRGDVWKHAVLVAVASRIQLNEACVYVETHCGAPEHRLTLSGEWQGGIGKAVGVNAQSHNAYVAAALGPFNLNRYPAGWVFACQIFAARVPWVRAVLSDTSADVAASYHGGPSQLVPPNVSVEFRRANGFEVARGVNDPNLVFLDPPYFPDAKSDWCALILACNSLRARNIPFLAWYPLYWPTRPQQLCDETGCSAWEANWADFGPKPSQNMRGSGLLVSSLLESTLQEARGELIGLTNAMSWGFGIRKPRASGAVAG